MYQAVAVGLSNTELTPAAQFVRLPFGEKITRAESQELVSVADPLWMVLEQADCVARLNVMREDEHADLGMLCPDLLRGEEALVRVRRRHADVDDRSVRSL